MALIQPVNTPANGTRDIYSDNLLTTNKLVAAVLQANPQLQVAQATWQASLTRIEQQSSLDDPQFNYSFAPLTIDNQKSNYGQRVEISQNLPFPGKLSARGKAAEYQAETSQQNIATLQLLLASKAKTLFADWYFIHQAISINQLNQTLLKEFRGIAKSQYSTGQFSKQDVLQADVEQALIKHRAILLQRQRKTILAQLNTLLNRSPELTLPAPEKLIEISELPDLKQLQIRAMQSRPELKSITASINVHQAQTELAELAYYPDLKLSAGYNSLWDNEDKRFNIGIGINIPLDQSKRRASEQEARAKSQQAHWRKIDLEAKIKEELAVAYAHVEESLHILQLHQKKLLPLANENMAATKVDYQTGKDDFLSLISSKKNRNQTQLQTEQALADLHRNFAELERVVGSIAALSLTDQNESKTP